ncbi:MAG: hypothetical protein CMP56_04730 [Flavobacteriales bacterium]|nr:hypothetical protein [Flavobacteriales bacterium]|tara:strand:+ start:2235 stop:2981 length:747 start_codon:yes stop_codon:yes gene_type:complete
MANPALAESQLSKLEIVSNENAMTINGTVNKTLISLSILLIAASFTFANPVLGINLILPGFILGFIVALVTIFKKEWAPITVPIYALLEGLALGGISLVYEEFLKPEGGGFDGIVIQAMGLTACILFGLLFAYRTKMIVVTQKLRSMIVTATIGVFLFFLLNIIMSLFFGSAFESMNPLNGSLTSIGISIFIVGIAAFNLLLDFDLIEKGAEKGWPKYMEWYGAFGLLVTLVWLYLEVLRLLAKLRSR